MYSINHIYNITIETLPKKSSQAIVCFVDYKNPTESPKPELVGTFPYVSDIKPPRPGSIKLLGTKQSRYIIVFGSCNYIKSPGEWFADCVAKLSAIRNLKSIAFSDQILRSLSDHDVWIATNAIKSFASKNPNIQVSIVHDFLIERLSETSPTEYNMDLLFEKTVVESTPSWNEFYEIVKEKDIFQKITEKFNTFDEKAVIYPEKHNIFRAFFECSLKDMKAVVIGQDPYHTKGAAVGLAFGHDGERRLQPSIKNIFKELKSDYSWKKR